MTTANLDRPAPRRRVDRAGGGALLLLALLGAATLGAPRTARAQPATAPDPAQKLFDEGLELMRWGKIKEACPKLAESQKLGPSSGTLLNLAECYRKDHRYALAWILCKQAASLAMSSGDHPGNVKLAHDHADALVPNLSWVTLSVPHPVDGLEIKFDDVVLAREDWGHAPVDPGDHAYEAKAPGYKAVTVRITVPGPTITIPDLEKEPGPVTPGPVTPGPVTPGPVTPGPVTPGPVTVTPAPVVPVTPGPVAPGPVTPAPVEPAPVAPGPVEPSNAWRPLRTGALIAGGAGVVGFVVGGVFAGLAKSAYNDSLSQCPRDPNRCTSEGVKMRDDARGKGNAATAGLVIGGLGAAAGVVLWFVAPPAAPSGDKHASLGISPGPGGVTVSGRW
jgi:hypothetical protein